MPQHKPARRKSLMMQALASFGNQPTMAQLQAQLAAELATGGAEGLRDQIVTNAAERDAEYQRSGYDASAGFGPGQRRMDLRESTYKRLGVPQAQAIDETLTSPDDFGVTDLAMGFSGGGMTLAGEKAVAGPLDAFMKRWADKGVKNSVTAKADGTALELHQVVVPKEMRGQGVGSEFMRDLTSHADQNGQQIVLSPSADFGGSSVDRLKRFYKRFGFVENKGPNKDFTISASMYRPTPTAPTQALDMSDAARAWFGDGKVVDATGNPLRLYHGTTHHDRILESGFKKGWTQFTDSKPIADSYQQWDRGGSPGTLEVYVNAKNPAYFDGGGQKYTDIGNKVYSATWDAEKAGHDALIIKNIRDHYDSSVPIEPHTTVVSFRPEQIRSVNAAFDPSKKNSGDLLASVGMGGLAALMAKLYGNQGGEQ